MNPQDDRDPDFQRLKPHFPSEDDDTTDLDTTVSDEDVELLKQESALLDGEDLAITAERLLKQSLGGAILAIGKLARVAKNEKTRLEAAKYIVDRNLGRIADTNPTTAGKNPLESLLGEVVDHR